MTEPMDPPSWDDAFAPGAFGEALGRDLLPGFLAGRRWYAGKARALESLRIVDGAQPAGLPRSILLALAEARYRDGAPALYFLPLGLARGAEAERRARDEPARVVGRWHGAGSGGALVYDALADPEVGRSLLDAIEHGRETLARSGRIVAAPTGALPDARGPEGPAPGVRVGTAEQSNSALFFGDRLFLKVFRKLEPGINPDFEIGRFLSERTGFDRIPATAGVVEYRAADGTSYTLGILQGLVANQGTGWEHALDALGRYYERCERAADGGAAVPDAAAAGSVIERSARDVPAEVRAAVGDYLDAAGLLGRRTAELHRALASDPDDPAFAPEPLSGGDLADLRAHVRAQGDRTLSTLRAGLDRLPDALRAPARRVLDAAPRRLAALDRLPAPGPGSTRIRCHGDYHLGQALRTGDDFVILDFEGEPSKSLADRRAKQSPIKDVVGMLRSFDYAAAAALFRATEGRPGARERLEPWGRLWADWVSASFLGAYRAAAQGASFLPASEGDLAALLHAFTLDKALYELDYELNNRPDWVAIPLRGVLALIDEG